MNDEQNNPQINNTQPEFKPATPQPTDQPVAPKQSNRWIRVSVIMSALTILPAAIFMWFLSYYLLRNPYSELFGSFMGLVVMPLFFMFPAFLLADLILAITYLTKIKPQRSKQIFPIFVIVVALLIPAFYFFS